MNEYFPILAPVIGIVGVVVGVLLNEFMRRRSRRELYAPKIFEKRLAAYEGLIEQIHQGSKVANEVIERVVGQTIVYYPISLEHTNFHDVYGEAIDKNFLKSVGNSIPSRFSVSFISVSEAGFVPNHLFSVCS